jgi:hypothetical protein
MLCFMEAQIILDEKYKADYLGFLDACKAKDFKNWAEYEFKTELKPDPSDFDDF